MTRKILLVLLLFIALTTQASSGDAISLIGWEHGLVRPKQ